MKFTKEALLEQARGIAERTKEMGKKARKRVNHIRVGTENLFHAGEIIEGTNGAKPVLKNEFEYDIERLVRLFDEKQVYVVGYGSLMATPGWFNRGMVFPPRDENLMECTVENYIRGPYGLFGRANFYGVVRKSGKNINAVLTRIRVADDWYHLMNTEMIVGIHSRYCNYRVVDVTEDIRGVNLPENAVVHMVANRPANLSGFFYTLPAASYYDRVWKWVKTYRGEEFAKEFLATGGFQSSAAVRAFTHEQWVKRNGGDAGV